MGGACDRGFGQSASCSGSAKSFTTGQCPVERYNRQLTTLILKDEAHIAGVFATVIGLDEAPRGQAVRQRRGEKEPAEGAFPEALATTCNQR